MITGNEDRERERGSKDGWKKEISIREIETERGDEIFFMAKKTTLLQLQSNNFINNSGTSLIRHFEIRTPLQSGHFLESQQQHSYTNLDTLSSPNGVWNREVPLYFH